MKTTDVLGCVGSAAFLLLASAWIPFIGPFFSLLTPLPFLCYTTRLGLRQGIKLAAVAVFTIGLLANFMGQPQVMLFVLEFSIIGVGLSALFRRELALGQTLFLATVFMLLLGFALLFFIGLSKNMGPIEMILAYLAEHMDATIAAYKNVNVGGADSLALETYAKAFILLISKIYPSLMIIGTGFALWLNIVIAKPLFRLWDLKYPHFNPMDRWQSPEFLVWGVIISGFGLFLSSGSIEFLAINALIVILAIYIFHGLSIVLFFFNKYKVPTWIRVGAYFLIMIQQLFFVVLILAGLFDQWADFRKIHRRASS